MGIYLKDLKEGCCEYLSSLNCLNGDDFDPNRATCDKIIECDSKYILVEEKSFILGFFQACCQEKQVTFGKFIECGILKDEFFEFLEDKFTIDEKRRLFAESVTQLFMSSLNKVSNTTHILATKYHADKSTNMPIIYLYCKSGKSKVDKLASLLLAKYKNETKQVMVECDNLEKFLKLKGCA